MRCEQRLVGQWNCTFGRPIVALLPVIGGTAEEHTAGHADHKRQPEMPATPREGRTQNAGVGYRDTHAHSPHKADPSGLRHYSSNRLEQR